jgi:signal transduction histidine kinase
VGDGGSALDGGSVGDGGSALDGGSVGDGDWFVVSVADNGPGVPDAEKERIFGRKEESDLEHGEGIGLYFVDRIVTTYGGDVWVEDGPEGGAVFRVQLPRPDRGT